MKKRTMKDKRIVRVCVFHEPAHPIKDVLLRGLLARGAALVGEEDDVAWVEFVLLCFCFLCACLKCVWRVLDGGWDG